MPNRIANVTPSTYPVKFRIKTVTEPIVMPYNHFPAFVVGLVTGSVAIKNTPKSNPPANKCHTTGPNTPGIPHLTAPPPMSVPVNTINEPKMLTTVRQLATLVNSKNTPPKIIKIAEVSPALPETLPKNKCEIEHISPLLACASGVATVIASTAEGSTEKYSNNRPVSLLLGSNQLADIAFG